MRSLKKFFIIAISVGLFLSAFILPASGEPSFTGVDIITVPDGAVASQFKAVFNVDSGTENIPFYLWSWKIVNRDDSSVYHYWDGSPPKEKGKLSQLVLCPGTYYVMMDAGDNEFVDLKLSYDYYEEQSYRYTDSSSQSGYTVYDFDYEPHSFISGNCGYFSVLHSYKPQFYGVTPAYIMHDYRYRAYYFDTDDGYYIFDGSDKEPILYDRDDEVIIVDDGDGKITIVDGDE